MKTRPLGSSGIEASVVALGTWQLGGWMWGGNSEDDSVQAVHAAIDHGITLLDTAPAYGFGVSEEVVGKAIKDRRDKVVLATKCGMVARAPNGRGERKFRSSAYGADPRGMIPIDVYLDPESIREELELSLKRLGTDHVDLYQTHWQEKTTAVEDTMGCLLQLKDRGKLRAIGCCNASPDHLGQYLAAGQLDADQEQFNMLDRHAEDDGNLALCREKNVAVLAYSPLGRGLLTGKIDADYTFKEGDHRASMDLFSQDNRERVMDMLNKFKPILEDKGVSMVQLAIAWTVHQPGLTHALCGARNAKQAESNAGAGDIELSDQQLRTMEEAIEAYHHEGVSA